MNRFHSHLFILTAALTFMMVAFGCSDSTSSGSGVSDVADTSAADTVDDSQPDAVADAQPDQSTTPDATADPTEDLATVDQTIDVEFDTTQPDLEDDIDLTGFDCLDALFVLLYVVGDSIDLEGTGGTCPAHEREGEGVNQTITLTYGESCDWSGVITLATERTGVGQGNVTVSFTDLTMDDSAVDGSMSGTYTLTTGEANLNLTVDLDLTGTTACDITGTVDVSLYATELTVDGTLTINTSEFDVDMVAITYVELATECPLPYSGTITVDPTVGATMSVEFDENSPVDGTVDISVGPVDYEDMDYCAYW